MKELKLLLKEIQRYCEEGNRKALTSSLREIMHHRQHYYHDSIVYGLQDPYSDTLYKILLLDLDEEENDSIEIAELAYIGLGSILSDPLHASPQYYKRRLLLLHYFSDYFTDAIIEIFLKKYRNDNRLEARNLALECIGKMQIADVLWLEQNFPEFIDNDEQINEVCNATETHPEMTDSEYQEAILLHKVLFAFLKTKYKNERPNVGSCKV